MLIVPLNVARPGTSSSSHLNIDARYVHVPSATLEGAMELKFHPGAQTGDLMWKVNGHKSIAQ